MSQPPLLPLTSQKALGILSPMPPTSPQQAPCSQAIQGFHLGKELSQSAITGQKGKGLVPWAEQPALRQLHSRLSRRGQAHSIP